MRAFALFALALPALVAAQISCDSGTALCCFSTQERTPDSIAQLSALPQFAGVDIPSDDGDIGLLCSALDDTCADSDGIQACCTNNDFTGVSFGCTEPAASS